MKFKVYRTSTGSWEDDLEIGTLEELLDKCKEINLEIIISIDPPTIELLDDYRE